MTVVLRRHSGAAAVVLAALWVSACSGTTGGTAAPAPGPSSSAVDPNVPKVAAPLDVSAYTAKPCETVPSAVLSSLDYTAPGQARTGSAGDTAAGPYCAWMAGAEGLSVQVGLLTGNRDRGIGGLAGLYAGKASGQVGFLEPAPEVAGYPAVYTDLRDRRASGDCSLDVGIADDLVFSVSAQGYQGQQDSCQAAGKVAAAVVSTLKGA